MAQTQTASQTKIRTEKRSHFRIILGVILFLTLMVAYLDRVNISVILADPHFIAEMDLKSSPTAQGLLMSFFLFAYGISNVIFGPIGDWLGPRKAMSISILSWCVAVSFGALAKTLNILYISRIVLGMGEAMHWPMQSTFCKNWFPVTERGRANAAWVVGLMVGPAFAMPLFSAVVGAFGWRASFWLCAILGLMILPLIWFLTTDRPDQHKRVNAAELQHILEGQREEREKEKMAPEGSFSQNFKLLIRNGDFWLNALSYYGTATMWWGVLSWLPSYLKMARGLNWTQMGMLSALPYILGTISVLLVGVISDRYVRRASFSAVGLAGSALFIYLGAVAQDNILSAYLIAVSVFFLGINIPMSWSILQAVVPSRLVGTAAGLQNGSSQFIAGLAPAIIGYIIGATGSYIGGLMYLVAWGTLGALCSFALVLKKY